jgi:hypothetical protein
MDDVANLELLRKQLKIAESIDDHDKALEVAVRLVYEEARSWGKRMADLRCVRSVDGPLARAIAAMNEAEKRVVASRTRKRA